MSGRLGLSFGGGAKALERLLSPIVDRVGMVDHRDQSSFALSPHRPCLILDSAPLQEKRALTSERKINANRANARASTGPKTAPGRTRVARNAFRHGLSLPVCSDPVLSEEVETLARKIAGPDADAISMAFARQIAEAQIDLRRVCDARHRLLSNTMSNQYYDTHANARRKVKLIGLLLRPDAPEMSVETLTKLVTSTPQGPRKLATILSQEAKQLLALDRYERRARSKRKSAIRGFDATQKQSRSVMSSVTSDMQL